MLDNFDQSLHHQGNEEIIKKLVNEKIEFYDKDSGPGHNFKKIEQNETKDFIEKRDCDDCKTVKELKSFGTVTGKLTKLHSETHIFKALKFADKFHAGSWFII